MEAYENIPVLRLLKEPSTTLNELYSRYPSGGEYGWFAFVKESGTFAYWDISDRTWKLIGAGGGIDNIIEQLFASDEFKQQLYEYLLSVGFLHFMGAVVSLSDVPTPSVINKWGVWCVESNFTIANSGIEDGDFLAGGCVVSDGSKLIPIGAKIETDKALVSPTITALWTLHNGDQSSTVVGKDIEVVRGAVVDLYATFKWIHDNSKKDPTDGGWMNGHGVCPASGENSTPAELGGIEFNNPAPKYRYCTLYAPKVGLRVVDDRVVLPSNTDMDTTSDRCSVTFISEILYGTSETAAITDLSLVSLYAHVGQSGSSNNTHNRTINDVSVAADKYFFYAFRYDISDLTHVIMDDALDVLSAFNKLEDTISYTNDYGLTETYKIYVTANRGAFTNNKLEFK